MADALLSYCHSDWLRRFQQEKDAATIHCFKQLLPSSFVQF
jgi:hypothetical protein